jgi:hypothetical protein
MLRVSSVSPEQQDTCADSLAGLFLRFGARGFGYWHAEEADMQLGLGDEISEMELEVICVLF